MVNAVLGKVLAHNICCVSTSQSELGFEPIFWKELVGESGYLKVTRA
jgi:hypothetical protein